MTRVIVVADVRFYRDGLAELLARQAGCTVLGTASNRVEAVRRVLELRPEIVLLDSAIPEGLQTVRELGVSAPAVKVLVIALAETEHAVLAWAESGACGYVPRDASFADLVAALERAARGEQQCSTQVAGGMLRRLAALSRLATERNSMAPAVLLTPREREILSLVERGLSNKDIARHLGIGVATAKSHIHHIFEKLQVHSRTQATARLRLAAPELGSPELGSPAVTRP